jgi:hypothetical protein
MGVVSNTIWTWMPSSLTLHRAGTGYGDIPWAFKSVAVLIPCPCGVSHGLLSARGNDQSMTIACERNPSVFPMQTCLSGGGCLKRHLELDATSLAVALEHSSHSGRSAWRVKPATTAYPFSIWCFAWAVISSAEATSLWTLLVII